jgi:hypothetical protein
VLVWRNPSLARELTLAQGRFRRLHRPALSGRPFVELCRQPCLTSRVRTAKKRVRSRHRPYACTWGQWWLPSPAAECQASAKDEECHEREEKEGRTSAKKLRSKNFDSSRRATCTAREVAARVHVLVYVTLPPQRSRACVSCLCLHGLQLHGLSLCRFLKLESVSPLEKKMKVERAQATAVVAWILMESVHFLVLKTPISCGIPCAMYKRPGAGPLQPSWPVRGRARAPPRLSLSCDTPSRIASTPEPPRIPQPLTRAAMAAPRCSGVTDRGR